MAVAQSVQAMERIQTVIHGYRSRLDRVATEIERNPNGMSTTFFLSFQQIQSSILFEHQRLLEAKGKHVELQQNLTSITAEVEALELLRRERKTEYRKHVAKHEQELIEESSRVKNLIDQLESAKEPSNV